MTRDELIQKLIDCDGDLERLETSERVAVGMDPELQQLAEASRGLWTDVRRDFRVQAPPSFSFRVMEKVRAEAKRESWLDRLVALFRPAPAFAMGMALLVVLALAFFFLGQSGPLPQVAHQPLPKDPVAVPDPQQTPDSLSLRSQQFAVAGNFLPEEEEFSLAVGEEIDYGPQGQSLARITAHADARLRVSEERLELLSGVIDVDMYVKHRKPLVAFTRTTTVTIVGTEYILGVDEQSGATVVTVLSGKVMVSTKSGVTRYLTPGMEARIGAEGDLHVAEVPVIVDPILGQINRPVEDPGQEEAVAVNDTDIGKVTAVEQITLQELEAEIRAGQNEARTGAVGVGDSVEVRFMVVPVDDDTPMTDVNSLENRLREGIR